MQPAARVWQKFFIELLLRETVEAHYKFRLAKANKKMDKTIKNYLGFSLILGIIALAGSVFFIANSYNNSVERSFVSTFSATGEGKAVSAPDIAKFSFSVLTQGGKNIAELQKENAEKMNDAIEFLKSSGVENKDIATQNYNLEPRYQYFTCPQSKTSKPCPPAEIVGYSISQTVVVKVRNFDMISEILSGVVESGANSVSQLSFAIDDPVALKNQAREEAIAKAMEQAESVANAAGFKIGRLISINEGAISPIFRTKIGFAESADYGIGGMEALSPSIEPGSQEVTVNMTLTYEIK